MGCFTFFLINFYLLCHVNYLKRVLGKLENNPYWGYLPINSSSILLKKSKTWLWLFYPSTYFYSEWMNWTPWLKTCGLGNKRMRLKYCCIVDSNRACEPKFDFEYRDEISCPVHGKWSNWGNWVCTGKINRRRRQCDNPIPRSNGRPCPGMFKHSLFAFLFWFL